MALSLPASSTVRAPSASLEGDELLLAAPPSTASSCGRLRLLGGGTMRSLEKWTRTHRWVRLMDGLVDIYMPDFKFWDPATSSRLMKARDYPEVARTAILEMHRQVGELQVDDEGIATRGVLLRHLVMPDDPENTRKILSWIADELSPRTWVNIMDQYYPAGLAQREPKRFPSLQRRLRGDEHRAALEHANEIGLTRVDVPREEARRELVVPPR